MRKSRHSEEKAKTVLDTNVVISAAIGPEGATSKIFELLIREEIENYTTRPIIGEIEEVFNRKKIAEAVSDKSRRSFLRLYRVFSNLVEPEKSLDMVEDSDDNMFFECAEKANADIIISGDSHLQDIGSWRDMEVLSPRKFMTRVTTQSLE